MNRNNLPARLAPKPKEVEFPTPIRNALSEYPRLEASPELRARLAESVKLHLRHREHWSAPPAQPQRHWGGLTLRQALVSIALGIFGATLLLCALTQRGELQIRAAQEHESITNSVRNRAADHPAADVIPFRPELPW